MKARFDYLFILLTIVENLPAVLIGMGLGVLLATSQNSKAEYAQMPTPQLVPAFMQSDKQCYQLWDSDYNQLTQAERNKRAECDAIDAQIHADAFLEEE